MKTQIKISILLIYLCFLGIENVEAQCSTSTDSGSGSATCDGCGGTQIEQGGEDSGGGGSNGFFPYGTITADSQSITVGQTVGIHAAFVQALNNLPTGIVLNDEGDDNNPGAVVDGNQFNLGYQANMDYYFTPSSPGSYTFYSRIYIPNGPSWGYAYYYTMASVTVNVLPTPNPPTANIWADTTTIYVGQSVGIHADYSIDTGDGDTFYGSQMYSPQVPGLGDDTSPQSHRDYTFTAPSLGSYTFYTGINTAYYSWSTYSEVTVNVVPEPVTFTGSPATFIYNGSAQGPTITPSDGAATWSVTAGTATATAAGSYSVTVTANGNFTGSSVISYTINPKPVTFTGSPATFTYNGSAQGPTITPSDGAATWSVTAGTAMAVASGSYSVTATANGNFTGSSVISYTINNNSVAQNVTLNPSTTTVTAGQSAVFTASGAGPGNPGAYIWSLPPGASAVPGGTSAVQTITFNTVGSGQIVSATAPAYTSGSTNFLVGAASSTVAVNPNNVNVSVTVIPAGSGTVSGGGTYTIGQSCTLTPAAAGGYYFAGLSSVPAGVSSSGATLTVPSPATTFTVTGNVSVTASFSPQLPQTVNIGLPSLITPNPIGFQLTWNSVQIPGNNPSSIFATGAATATPTGHVVVSAIVPQPIVTLNFPGNVFYLPAGISIPLNVTSGQSRVVVDSQAGASSVTGGVNAPQGGQGAATTDSSAAALAVIANTRAILASGNLSNSNVAEPSSISVQGSSGNSQPTYSANGVNYIWNPTLNQWVVATGH
jgi:hypothetical protein